MGHHSPDVRKIYVDVSCRRDHIGDPLDRLPQDIVRHLEGFQQRCGLIDDAQESLIGNDQERIHVSSQLPDSFLGMAHTAVSLVLERLRHHSDGQGPQFARDVGHDRRGARAGPASHACGHKDHVRAFQTLLDGIFAFQRRLLAHLRFGPCAEAPGPFRSQLDLEGRNRSLQGLQVGVGRDEFHTAEPCADHRVHCVAAGSAHTDDPDANRHDHVLLK